MVSTIYANTNDLPNSFVILSCNSTEGDAMKEPIKQQETGENLNTSPPINSRNLLSKKFPPRSAVIINELTNQSGKIKVSEKSIN